MLTFKLMKGNDVQDTIDCVESEVEPGQSVALDCMGDDAGGTYRSITIQDTF